MTIARSKITDLDTVSEARYIYESPDGGLTVYQREVGSDIRVLVKTNPTDIEREANAKRHRRVLTIVRLAKTDPTLNDALEQLEALYILKYGDNEDY